MGKLTAEQFAAIRTYAAGEIPAREPDLAVWTDLLNWAGQESICTCEPLMRRAAAELNRLSNQRNELVVLLEQRREKIERLDRIVLNLVDGCPKAYEHALKEESRADNSSEQS